MLPQITLRKDRNNTLYLYLKLQGKKMYFSTGITVKDPSCFKEGRVTRRDELYKEKNTRITEILSQASTLAITEKDVSKVRQGIASILGNNTMKEKSLAGYLGEYAGLKSGRTKGLYESTARKVRAFRDAGIGEIDVKWLREFEQFCAKTMSVNGYAIHMRNIRAVFNYLIDRGEVKNYPFRRYKIKQEKTIHRALGREEVKAIAQKDCTESQGRYRDFFMLSFYLMGINPKDLMTLKPEDMQGERITYRRHKTGKLFDIKVEPEALHLINIYRGKDHLLCFMDNRKDYLTFLRNCNRSLGKLREGLTMYWARHTWATLAFKAGVRKEVISKALGHSFGIKVTDTYIEYDNEEVDDANRKVLDYIK